MEKPIFNGLYFACTDGNIKTNNWRNCGRTMLLKPAKDSKGYLRVGLMVDGKLLTKKVHRLIAEAFILRVVHL